MVPATPSYESYALALFQAESCTRGWSLIDIPVGKEKVDEQTLLIWVLRNRASQRGKARGVSDTIRWSKKIWIDKEKARGD